MPTEVLSLRAYMLRRRAGARCQAPILLSVTVPACETRWSDKVFPSRTPLWALCAGCARSERLEIEHTAARGTSLASATTRASRRSSVDGAPPKVACRGRVVGIVVQWNDPCYSVAALHSGPDLNGTGPPLPLPDAISRLSIETARHPLTLLRPEGPDPSGLGRNGLSACRFCAPV